MSSAVSQPVMSAKLSQIERDHLVALLEETREKLRQAVSGVPAAKAALRPGPGEWSILDCVEHLAVSDEAILSLVTDQILAGPADPGSVERTQGKAALVEQAMRDRSSKRKTFAYLEPEGRWPELADALAAFELRRQSSIDFVRATEADVHWHTAPLGALGDLDACHWLFMMAIHTERHIGQIQEVKAAPAYSGATEQS